MAFVYGMYKGRLYVSVGPKCKKCSRTLQVRDGIKYGVTRYDMIATCHVMFYVTDARLHLCISVIIKSGIVY